MNKLFLLAGMVVLMSGIDINESPQVRKHIYLDYMGSIQKIRVAVDSANKVLNDPRFYAEIRKHAKFDNTDSTPVQIANLLESSTDTIRIFAKWMPIANAKTEEAGEIKVSRKNFSSVLSDAMNTLIHETVHAIDWKDGQQTFTHSSNDNSDGKQDNTAPWVIGDIAERIILGTLKL